MTRKQDWDVETGWEKRIKVDYGSIGPSHVRWSDWTYKERDIVARKVHEKIQISKDHGPRSRRMADWAKEHEPIMIGFARDDKPMPDWAHADFRESGVPEHVKVVWKRKEPDNPASPADWAYDPPGPWDKGEEPAWSAVPGGPVPLEAEGGMDPKYGGVLSYTERANGDRVDQNGNVISTRESRAKEDVPNWKKFELGRLEDVDGVIIPGPNALPKDVEKYGQNVKHTNIHKTRDVPQDDPVKIMPDDPKHTPLEKALNWAAETRHGPEHQVRWNRVAAALGADNGYEPMTLDEIDETWVKFNRNRRWTMALDAVSALEGVGGTEESVPAAPKAAPKAAPTPQPEGEWRLKFGSLAYGRTPPAPGATGWYTREEKWLPQWYWDLPELTFEEGEAQGMTSRANVAPQHYIYHKKGVGVLGRQKPAPVRDDLPVWTKAEAAAYYQAKGIKMRSRQWLDGHLMQRPGYTDTGDGRGVFVARAADEAYEKEHTVCAVPNAMAEALKAGDWAAVAKLAKEMAL